MKTKLNNSLTPLFDAITNPTFYLGVMLSLVITLTIMSYVNTITSILVSYAFITLFTTIACIYSLMKDNFKGYKFGIKIFQGSLTSTIIQLSIFLGFMLV